MRLLVLLVVLTACGTQAGAPERACTAIGAMPGISVAIAPSVAARFGGTAGIDVCWNGSCHGYPVVLTPATTAVATPCTGGPDDTCGARMRETGGKTGFATVPGLPAAPVTLTFSGETVSVTPELVYPNGPACGAGGPQAKITVDEKGVR
ncbi:hypothetical protein [Amycolatopsis alkalitolerans]|uniref:Uncharacterized protein n=1 Tax=Amycolatopsis alkalitolerans TaxID=2547244 RepID=A0A5C4MDF2_9PSEU|nr:hypothetical protein [Amycolatopsis alkalitolerans]TNC29563.1 hypothetical protein FG385_00915 [Amycolatopsis alkalitolerans]